MTLKNIVADVLDKEIKGLEDLKESFSFEILNEIVEKVHCLRGKLIVSGIGKSGYVARKATASLCSIGVPAVFLHSAEALHGDLGVITNHDIVMIFSNSGEGNELKQIIRHCTNLKVTTIGVSRDQSSFLIQKTDIGIVLPNTPEVSNLDIPTTSSVMMIAFCDVLIVALKEKKNLSQDEYLLYHPGGKIGMNGMKVKDIMIIDIPLVKNNSSILDTLITMSNKKLGFVLVVNDSDELIGVVTCDSIKHMLSNNSTITNLITHRYKVISSDLRVSDITNDIKQYDCLVILNDKKPVGVLSYESLKSFHKC